MLNFKALFSRSKPVCATELDLLQWAAGSVRPLPQVDGINESQLLLLVEQHRLPHRFLDRLERERPAWCGSGLWRGLLQLRAQAETTMRRQIAATREIAAALDSPRPLITIKGFSAFALTGDKRHIRLSGDLDLLSEDVEQLWETLEKLSYQGVKNAETFNFPAIPKTRTFELGGMFRGDLKIEPHKYYGVWSYPQEVLEATLAPTQFPKLWVQGLPEPVQKEICYSDLLANSHVSRVGETRGLVVPNAALLVLILCAHEFQLSQVQCFRRGYLKLSTLADIRDLVGHVSFDPKQFLALVEKFDAHDALCYAGLLLETYLGVNPLPSCRSRIRPTRLADFPRLLIPPNRSFWILPPQTDEPMFCGNVDATRHYMKHLGANTVAATRQGRRKFYRLAVSPDSGSGERDEGILERAITSDPQGQCVPLRLAAIWNETELRIECCLAGAQWKPNYEYYIHIWGYQWNGLHPKASAVREPEEDQLLVCRLAWDALPPVCREMKSFFLLLSVACQNPHCPPAVLDPITLVPLRVLRP